MNKKWIISACLNRHVLDEHVQKNLEQVMAPINAGSKSVNSSFNKDLTAEDINKLLRIALHYKRESIDQWVAMRWWEESEGTEQIFEMKTENCFGWEIREYPATTPLRCNGLKIILMAVKPTSSNGNVPFAVKSFFPIATALDGIKGDADQHTSAKARKWLEGYYEWLMKR